MPADKSEKIDSSDMMDTHRLRGLEGGGVEGLRFFCTATNWMFCGYLWTISLGSYFFGINTPLGTGRTGSKLSDFC